MISLLLLCSMHRSIFCETVVGEYRRFILFPCKNGLEHGQENLDAPMMPTNAALCIHIYVTIDNVALRQNRKTKDYRIVS